jgi:lipid-A-disaccharide synthase
MKYFIIAGEPSGDLHGSNLISHLFMSDPEAEISCWGGDLMKEAGGISSIIVRQPIWVYGR